MPAKPRKSRPDKPAIIVLRIPGHLKNRMIDHGKKLGVPYTNWATHALIRSLNDDLGVPPPPPARVPFPTEADQIRSYLTGERLTLPCGRVGDSCPGTERPERIAGYDFCPECSIRVM